MCGQAQDNVTHQATICIYMKNYILVAILCMYSVMSQTDILIWGYGTAGLQDYSSYMLSACKIRTAVSYGTHFG